MGGCPSTRRMAKNYLPRLHFPKNSESNAPRRLHRISPRQSQASPAVRPGQEFCLSSRPMQSLWDIANPQLRELSVYEPGKPIEETARELNIDPREIIKLASNENPLGPSPKAIEAMRVALNDAQLYPDGGGFYLRNALASKLGVRSEERRVGKECRY